MIAFTQPVKYMGTKTNKGISTKSGKPFEVTEAVFSYPDLGRIKVMVDGNPKFPDVGTVGMARFAIDQGSFQSLKLVCDNNFVFQPSK